MFEVVTRNIVKISFTTFGYASLIEEIIFFINHSYFDKVFGAKIFDIIYIIFNKNLTSNSSNSDLDLSLAFNLEYM